MCIRAVKKIKATIDFKLRKDAQTKQKDTPFHRDFYCEHARMMVPFRKKRRTGDEIEKETPRAGGHLCMYHACAREAE